MTTRHARETMAERICARFFTAVARTASPASGDTPQAEFATAGQHLQALSGGAEMATAGPQNLAAILTSSAHAARTVARQGDESGETPADAGLTAKAA